MSNKEIPTWIDHPGLKTPDRKYVDPLMEERGLDLRGGYIFRFYAVMSREAKAHGMTLADYLRQSYLEEFGDEAQMAAYKAGVPFEDIIA